LHAKAILISNLFGVQEVCHLTLEIYIVNEKIHLYNTSYFGSIRESIAFTYSFHRVLATPFTVRQERLLVVPKNEEMVRVVPRDRE
jgi:hypothetical protein